MACGPFTARPGMACGPFTAGPELPFGPQAIPGLAVFFSPSRRRNNGLVLLRVRREVPSPFTIKKRYFLGPDRTRRLLYFEKALQNIEPGPRLAIRGLVGRRIKEFGVYNHLGTGPESSVQKGIVNFFDGDGECFRQVLGAPHTPDIGDVARRCGVVDDTTI